MPAKKLERTGSLTSLEQVRGALRRIGALCRGRARLEDRASQRAEKIASDLVAAVAPIDTEVRALGQLIRQYCDRHRTAVFGDAQTADLTTGAVSYRRRPARVDTDGTPDLIEQIIARNRLKEFHAEARTRYRSVFLRMTLSLDKSAILKDRAAGTAATGVAIAHGEERFYIRVAGVHADEIEVSDAA